MEKRKRKSISRKLDIVQKSARRSLRRDILARRLKLQRTLEFKRLKRIRSRYIPPYSHCKNCGTELKGMYCHNCGQYALDSRQPFWKYILQYFENVYQFDTKIWSTLWYLFSRPGFLTTEFNSGKIASYVHPMRLFMCITLLFFIGFFMFVGNTVENAMGKWHSETIIDELEDASPEDYRAMAMFDKDTVVAIAVDIEDVRKYPEVFDIIGYSAGDTLSGGSGVKDTVKVRMPSVYLETFEYREDLDGVGLYATPAPRMDERESLFIDGLLGILSGYAPLFSLFLVPIMAFMLKGLYRKKHMMYMNHLAFSLHWGCFFYIMTALFILVGELWHYNGVPWYIFLGINLLYTTVAMHWVYGDNWVKTLLKTILLCVVYFFIVLVLTGVFFVWALYSQKDNLPPSIAVW